MKFNAIFPHLTDTQGMTKKEKILGDQASNEMEAFKM